MEKSHVWKDSSFTNSSEIQLILWKPKFYCQVNVVPRRVGQYYPNRRLREGVAW
jgi:hypothetical protein